MTPEHSTRDQSLPGSAEPEPVSTRTVEKAVTPPPLPSVADRYILGEEIARGGMGEVYRATDTALTREVAIKVLQEQYGPTSATARRFFDEARITGQLQHPGIPPVHDLGTLPDGRPFLAMKLIKGETLADLLKTRSTPLTDRGRYIAAFEQICQAVAYAHAHDVIHRDLKPSNVMVGNFGEVQVMDWGLAKILRSDGLLPADVPDDPETTMPRTAIRTEQDSDTPFTQAGSVLGTPAFMPPEQAIGAVDQIDRRSDVFGLGGILAAILTGQPPFVGKSAESIRQMAAKGQLADCFARLDASGAEPELIALCKNCLAAEQTDRPTDAGAVAEAVAALRVAADERARQAEFDRERAVVREAEGRKRRRVWVGLAGVLALGVLASVGLALVADRARRSAVASEQTAETRRQEADDARQKEAAARTQADEARQKEAAARKKAEDETQLANDVKRFLQQDVLRLADPVRQHQDRHIPYDADVKLRDVMIRAAKAIDGKFPGRPLVESELRMTIGSTLISMGRVDLAVTQFEQLKALLTKQLGPDHPDTLESMKNLAMRYAAMGRRDEALKLREETLALRKAKLGHDHPDTLKSMHDLACSYADMGRWDEALNLHEQTLALQKAKLGPDHPDTFFGMAFLALSYASVGRLAEAMSLNEESLKLMKSKFGPDHPVTLTTMDSMATSYAVDGCQGEALKLREETLALRKAKLGQHHPLTLVSMSYVIDSLMDLKRSDEALPRIDEVLNLADQATANGKQPYFLEVPTMLAFRFQILHDRKDVAGCRTTAERYEQLGRTDSGFLYDAACNRAIIAGLLGSDPPAAKLEADLAMQWLRKAVAAGWEDRAHMETDTDLDVLRSRDDFRELVGGLRYQAPPPRRVKR